MKKVFVSDCEGPISLNDNAFETASHFIPNGGRIFTAISRYDDVLADVIKRPGYRAGDTVKLVLPFLKAYGATDEKMRRFATQNLALVRGAEEMLRHVRTVAPAFIVSTSYEHYVQVLCAAVGFPFENTFCTRFSLDNYRISPQDRKVLKDLAREIGSMPMLELPLCLNSGEDLTDKDNEIIRRLDEIFWTKVSEMDVGRIYSDVRPVGGSEKEKALIEIARKMRINVSQVMYVGDSITDVEAFKLVKKNGGLTVSFNGNQYAVRNAEIAIISDDATVTSIVADVFVSCGKQESLRLADNWQSSYLQKSQIDKQLLKRFLKARSKIAPEVKLITASNMEALVKKSMSFRKRVRGKVIGSLG
jgi:energy-converting hydrogenase A subunit R